jgi:phosphopantothenoylcysteine decarboxylase
MYQHPITHIQLTFIKETLGYIVIDPISKKLACGDVGIGAMQEPSVIAEKVKECILHLFKK